MLKSIGIVSLILSSVIILTFDLGSKSFIDDEVEAIEFANQPSDLLQARYYPGLLYCLALHFWMKIGDDEVMLRLLSVFFGIVSLVILYNFAGGLIDYKTSFLGAIFFVLSAECLLYLRIALHYALYLLLSLLSFYHWFLYLNKSRLINLILFLLFCIGAFLAYYAYIIFVPLLVVMPLILDKKKKFFCLLPVISVVVAVLLINFITGIAFIKLHSKATYTLFDAPSYTNFLGMIGKGIYCALALSIGETFPLSIMLISFCAAFFGYCFIKGMISLHRTKPKVFLIVVFGCIVPIILSSFSGRFSPRYILPAIAFYLIPISSGVLLIKKFLPRLIIITCLICLNLISIYNYFTNRGFHFMMYVDPNREAAKMINDSFNYETDLIIVYSRSIRYYLEKMDQIQLRNYRVMYIDGLLYYKGSKISVEELVNIIRDSKPSKRLWFVKSFVGSRPDSIKALNTVDNLIKQLESSLIVSKTILLNHDPDAPIKRKLITGKPFLDHRITILLFEPR